MLDLADIVQAARHEGLTRRLFLAYGGAFASLPLLARGDKPAGLDQLLADNPGVKFHNAQRGYVRCSVTPDHWQANYLVVDDVLRPGGRVSVRASFVLENGDPTIKQA